MLHQTDHAAAQLNVGGHIGLTKRSGGSAVGINIAPDIGFRFNDYLTVGGLISYRSLNNRFGIMPYLRCHLLPSGWPVRAFLTTQVPITFGREYFSTGVNFRPGISVKVSGAAWIYAHIGTFGYRFTNSSSRNDTGWFGALNMDNIDLGVCFKL